jgi:hypothetical protein
VIAEVVDCCVDCVERSPTIGWLVALPAFQATITSVATSAIPTSASTTARLCMRGALRSAGERRGRTIGSSSPTT